MALCLQAEGLGLVLGKMLGAAAGAGRGSAVDQPAVAVWVSRLLERERQCNSQELALEKQLWGRPVQATAQDGRRLEQKSFVRIQELQLT